jgi:hypothetical protein
MKIIARVIGAFVLLGLAVEFFYTGFKLALHLHDLSEFASQDYLAVMLLCIFAIRAISKLLNKDEA